MLDNFEKATDFLGVKRLQEFREHDSITHYNVFPINTSTSKKRTISHEAGRYDVLMAIRGVSHDACLMLAIIDD